MDDLGAELETFRQRHRVPAVVGAVVDREGDLRAEAIGVPCLDRSGGDPSSDESSRAELSGAESEGADLSGAESGGAESSEAESREPVTTDDRWHIGSCGKAMTAAVYARLVETGRAEWGLPVRSLFPDVTTVDPGWESPTIDDLLHSRAGVASNPPRSRLRSLHASTEAHPDQRSQMVAEILATAPNRPGRFRYSNLGYVMAGAAIDRLSGMTYEEALRTELAEPLGMRSLGFGPPPRLCGHRRSLQLGPIGLGGRTTASPGAGDSDNPPLYTPAGRMHLTIADWAAFQGLFLNRGAPLLGPASIEHLINIPGSGKGPSMAMGWASAEQIGASLGMQGSNTLWVATALIDRDRSRSAMVITNDGNPRLLRRTAELAARLLGLQPRR
ncbi:MAG: serine hydrolase domain-containing protein [Actinomycetota bacterium]